MQIALRPYVTAGAVIGATLIAITAVVTPDTGPRAPTRASSAESVALSSFDQVISDVEAVLAGLIDPDLAGAGAQAADATAAADLTSTASGPPGFATAVETAHNAGTAVASDVNFAEGELNQNPADYASAQNWLTGGPPIFVAGLGNDATGAAGYAGFTATDAAQAATALSAADPIQVFQDDLQTDWSQLLSDPFSSAMLTDLTATLQAAPGAAQEEIALLLDPAAVGQVTAYEYANGAAEAAATAQQQWEHAVSAATAAAAADPTTAAGDATIASETLAAASEASAASTAIGVSATDGTDAVNTLAGLSPESLSTELATLWTDLQALF